MPNPRVLQGSIVLISCLLPPWEHWPEGLETQAWVPVTLNKLLHLSCFLILGYRMSKTVPSRGKSCP